MNEAVGAHQYGVGAKDGANCRIKTPQCAAEADHDRLRLALDLKAAFKHVSRKAMLMAIQEKSLSELACTASATQGDEHGRVRGDHGVERC